MFKNFNHQKTIGVIGSSADAQEFVLQANQLGFTTFQLFQTTNEMKAWYGADKKFVGAFNHEKTQEDFLMQCDLLVYFDYSLNSTQLEEAQKSVVVPQGDDLMAIARDRALQKAFKESLSVNISPYETVVTDADIEEGLRRIGYPAVLRTNYLTQGTHKQSYFLYEEKDIEEAKQLLKYGTCILESWIVSDDELSVSVVKTASGAIKAFPAVKRVYQNNRLANVQVATALEQDVLEEMERVAVLIADNIQFTGALTIDFFISPAQALYVGNIYPFPNVFSRCFKAASGISVVEAHLRAIASLPLPDNLKDKTACVYVPFYMDQAETINHLITIYPTWQFNFYPKAKKEQLDREEAVGYLAIETENMKKTLALLRKNDL